MARHQFKSIKDKGGLRAYLDLSEQKAKHRGFGYKTFKILRMANLNVTNMALAFKVTFDTMKHWWAIDDTEVAARKAQQQTEMDELNNV